MKEIISYWTKCIWIIIFILSWQSEVQAGPMIIKGFEVTDEIEKGDTAKLRLDYRFMGVKQRIDIVLKGPLNEVEVAEKIADTINAFQGKDIASADGMFVSLQKGIGASIITTGTTPGIVDLFEEQEVSTGVGTLTFAPDPDTGMDVLVSTGIFSIQGPGGLNTSFEAPIGTTGLELAELFDSELGAAYSPFVVGNTVLFTPPTVGTVFFSIQGDGIEYELSSVPEPSSLTLLGIGIAGLAGYGWRRRQSA